MNENVRKTEIFVDVLNGEKEKGELGDGNEGIEREKRETKKQTLTTGR